MPKPLAVMALALALSGCVVSPAPGPRPPLPEKPPAPAPAPTPLEAGADLCRLAYEHMKELGCPPPEPRGGGTWADVCHNANDQAISMHEKCLLRIQTDPTCAVTDETREKGCAP